MKYRIRMQYYIAKIIRLLIKILKYFPNKKKRTQLIRKFKKLINRINPSLYESEDFLNYLYKKKIGFEEKINKIKTLALRGSTADYGFYSPLWDNSYNLGLTSFDLYSCYHLYKKYRKKLINLKSVIVFAGVFMPGFSVIKTSARYITVSYNFFFNIPYSEKKLINPKYEKWIINKCKNLKTLNIEPDYRGYDKKK